MRMSRIIFLALVAFWLFIIAGSFLFVKAEIDERKLAREEAIEKLIAEESPRVEKYLKYNYENIDSVTITGVDVNPTGIPHIMGYVNGDKKLSFDAGVYDEHYEGALIISGESFPYTKSLNQDVLSVSEIEEIEKNE
ncbi:DUF1433 domain-containing protein [Listeria sp. SHR_NRA_18]|nr:MULTISPECIES: DUF1433 domain-containing protein [Listeria]KGL38141.1 hypothetical protein EP56_16735 [Listeriaceae bacterium FSL A5-0209]KGL39307.1 hypothetical protein EP58_14190 [Listeria newyorkensis]RQW66107.1 DUF1433 domain-containing protein [Listeria sp. SHR_NRA_18]SQC54460.1 Protein of uncharacterised function (DUF1433) [Listeria newyorkensis]